MRFYRVLSPANEERLRAWVADARMAERDPNLLPVECPACGEPYVALPDLDDRDDLDPAAGLRLTLGTGASPERMAAAVVEAETLIWRQHPEHGDEVVV